MGARIALTSEEAADFERLKKTVHDGLRTFVEVGAALMEIRERKLYLATCSTFEAFVQVEFHMSRSYAYRNIAAAETVAMLSPMGDTEAPLPDSERTARPLTTLPPEQQQEAWAEAVEESDGKPTAKDVKRAVEKRRAPVKPHVSKPAEPVHPFVQQMVESPQDAPEAPQAASTEDGGTGTGEPVGAGEGSWTPPLSVEGSREVMEEFAAPPADTPERRETFARVDELRAHVEEPDSHSEGEPVWSGGGPSVVKVFLGLVPAELGRPTRKDVWDLTAEDRADLIATARWIQLAVVEYDAMKREPAHV